MRPFFVHGYMIHAQVIQAAEDLIKSTTFFACDIQALLEKAGVPRLAPNAFKTAKYHQDTYFVSSRAADRIIRHHRRNLKIIARAPKPLWAWKT